MVGAAYKTIGIQSVWGVPRIVERLMNSNTRIRLFIGTLSALFCADFAYPQVVIFEQLPASPPFPGLSSRICFDNRPDGLRTADDFVLQSDNLIREIRWWGGCHAQAPPSSCSPGGTDQFTFSFYSTSTDLPGPLLLETAGTLLGDTNGASYAAVLDTPFLATGGTRYWLSIFNEALHEPWGWTNSSGGNNESAHAEAPSFAIWNETFGFNVDTAFQLVVPEPANLWLALGVLFGIRRTRNLIGQRARAETSCRGS